jgi:NADPH-dependent curcumin reductase CurA
MGIQKNLALIFTEVPTGLPVVGKHIAVKDVGFDLESDAPVDGVTVELLYCSLDHFMRGLLREPVEGEIVPEIMAGTGLGTALRSEFSIGKVLKSMHSDFGPGDLILHRLPIQQFVAVHLGQTHEARRIPVDDGIDDLRHYLGALGMPGLTAYSGLYGVGRLRAGETIFVSSAASTVGQLAGQFAKSEGLKVIGSVGSDEKLQYILNEVGFDQGFNYKTGRPLDELKNLAPSGIQIYFDNVRIYQFPPNMLFIQVYDLTVSKKVGGAHLEAAIDHLSSHGRYVSQ